MQVLSTAASIGITIVNTSLKFIIRRTSLDEKPQSITALNVSVGLKLTLARFINSSLILLIVNFDTAT